MMRMRSRSVRRGYSLWVRLGFLHFCIFYAAQHVLAVETWTRWDQTLTSTKTYENPYREVSLVVSYQGPDQQQINGLGFWDGGNTFRIRSMFPALGRWTWKTSCSDTDNTGLHGQTGSVDVVRYSSENPL